MNMKSVGSTIGWAVIGLVLFVAIVFGGWEAGWWFRTQNVNRAAHMYEQSYGAQSAYIEELSNQIVQLDGIRVQISALSTPASEKSALQAQFDALNAKACSTANLITGPLPTQEATYVAANC